LAIISTSFSVWILPFHQNVDGAVFSYTGDTEEGETLLELFDKATLAISECSFRDGNKTAGHFTPTALSKLAEKAGIKKLVLTHLYPEMDEIDAVTIIKQNYSGTVEVGEDLKEYLIR